MRLSDKELLNFALNNGIISLTNIQEEYEMNERKKYLEMHEAKVWQSTDGNWYTYIHDINGKRRLIKRKTKAELQDKIIENYKTAETEPTFEKVFYEWVNKKYKSKEIQKQTYNRYIVDFQRFYMDTDFHLKKVRYLDENTLEDFIIQQILDKNLTSKGYGNLRIITRGTLQYARKRGYTNFNVGTFFNELGLSRKIFSKKKKSDKEKVFTQEELKEVKKILEQKQDITRLAVLFGIYTGMRVGEIVALKWEDVTKEYVSVCRHQIFYDENGTRIYEIADETKTEAGMREVVLIPETREILKKARKINPFTEYVFEKNGNPITIHTLSCLLYRTCEKLGISKRGMHALRRTYATMLLNAGVDEAIIINQMGHTDIETTKNYYYFNNKTNGRMEEIIKNAISF